MANEVSAPTIARPQAATPGPKPPKQKKDKKPKPPSKRQIAQQTYEVSIKAAYKAVTGNDWHPGVDKMPEAEQQGILYYHHITQFLKAREHTFLKEESGEVYLLISGERMPLAFDRANVLQKKLMLNSCGVTTVGLGAQAAMARLEVHAHDTAPTLALRRFSALSREGTRLYTPIRGGKILRIAPDGFKTEENGEGVDKYWLEYPATERTEFECEGPFNFYDGDPIDGLQEFERLLINTQSTGKASAWLAGMHEALFPFIRDRVSTRAILEHTGPWQNGKTSAAERFSLLLGRGKVYGSVSPAFLRNEGDQGLLVLDNKEQVNFNEALIEYCLLLATGATTGRSGQDGLTVRRNSARPVGVITSIEGGGVRGELSARIVSIQYKLKPGMPPIDRDSNYREIAKSRDQIMSALMHVVREWIGNQGAILWTDANRPQLIGYFNSMAQLLTAYEKVAGKPAGWAKALYTQWIDLSSEQADEVEEVEEWPIYKYLTNIQADGTLELKQNYTFEGEEGTLYVTEIASVLDWLQREMGGRHHGLAKTPQGLAHRLASCRFHRFRYVPNGTESVPEVRRTSTRRPVAFFIANPTVDGVQRASTIYDRCEVTRRPQ